MIIIIDHSISKDGANNAVYNSLFQFIITRKCDKYEIILYGDSKAFRYYKNTFSKSVFSSIVKIVFIPKSKEGAKRLNDYCNVKSCLLGNDFYLYISSDLEFRRFFVPEEYRNIEIARDMYDACLHARKGMLRGLRAFRLSEPYINSLLHSSIKRAFNLVRYELGFLYQEPVDDSFLLSIDEKERLLRVSFEKYKSCLNIFVEQSKNMSESTRKYIDVRLSYINRLDTTLKLYDHDTSNSDVYFFYSFYIYLICHSLYASKKYSLCVSTSIRILETYLTGYLISANRAKPDKVRIKLSKYNKKKSKYEWVGAGGFGNVWEVFTDEFPVAIDPNLLSSVNKVKDLRNKSIYGHGYLPLTSESAQLALDTAVSVISMIERNSSGKVIFTKMDSDWVYFNKKIQEDVLLDSFSFI